MSTYSVGFTADGSLKEIEVDEIKPSDGYLRCQSQIDADDELVGVFPFSSVEYVVHNEVSVSDVGGDSE